MAVTHKASPAPTPLLKNAAAAPVIYFDGCPAYGAFAGNIEIELATRVLMPKSDGSAAADMMCVAHLRCSPHAAQSLLQALQAALEMHNAVLLKAEAEPTRLNS